MLFLKEVLNLIKRVKKYYSLKYNFPKDMAKVNLCFVAIFMYVKYNVKVEPTFIWKRKMVLSCCIFFMMLVHVGKVASLKELHIGGVFPMEAGTGGWAGGQACLPAVNMALEDVNNDPTILPGYSLILHHHNSKCKSGLAAKQLFELLYTPPVKLILLSGCSPVTTVIAEAAPVWNLVVLSYGASSPALSNRARFPTLFRTHPSANMHNPTRVKLFEKFKWKRITILQSVEEVFASTAKDLEEECRRKDIRVDRQSFFGDPTDSVKTLVRQDARIIVGLFYVTEARRVLCQAYKHGLYGRKYVWFLIGWYADNWYIPIREEQINCTAQQMQEAAQYHFTTESIMLRKDNKKAISGLTGPKFLERLKSVLETTPSETGGFPEAPLAYDAVWALALALKCTLNKIGNSNIFDDFTYNNTHVASQIFECVKNTEFQGVSGKVMFSDLGDRIARTQIEQMQHGKYVIAGYYDATTHSLEWHNKEKWYGKSPPPDSTIIKKSLQKVNTLLYVVVSFLAFILIIASICLMIFNKKCAYRSIIIQSQPGCNNLLIIGCIMCASSLFLIGLPTGGMTIPHSLFPCFCYLKITLIMIGFSFAYGSMFAKVWVVHRIGVNENQKIALDDEGKSEPIPSIKFQSIVATLVGIDILILLVWIIVDPLKRFEQYFLLQAPAEGTQEDVKLLPVLELCESNQHEVWISVILGYKCLLLVFGIFMAYESRKLKLRYINDSRLAGMSIFNVAILSLFTAPVVCFLIRTQPDENFAFVSVTVILCIIISLGLVFFPKIRYVYRVSAADDETTFNNMSIKGTFSHPEQLAFENFVKENLDLKKQIEIKEQKVKECQMVLTRRKKHLGSMSSNDQLSSTCIKCIDDKNSLSKYSEDDYFLTSSPVTFITTAFMETQHTENSYDNCSLQSSEIIL